MKCCEKLGFQNNGRLNNTTANTMYLQWRGLGAETKSLGIIF